MSLFPSLESDPELVYGLLLIFSSTKDVFFPPGESFYTIKTIITE